MFFLSYLLILQEKLIHTLFLFDSLIPIVTSAYNFLLQYQPWDKFESHKGNDYQIKQLLVVEQILLISTLEKCLNYEENTYIHNNILKQKLFVREWNFEIKVLSIK